MPRRRWLWAAAAAVAVLAVGLVWYVAPWPSGTKFETAIGEHAAISLPDGSTLELNSNSLAWVDYSERARVIRLERGEGFFKVAHDAARPFWVVGDGSWVRAVGTAFNVDLRGDGVRVTVSEGTVKVAAVEPAGSRAPSDEALTKNSVSVVTAGQAVDMHGSTGAVRTTAPVPPVPMDSPAIGCLTVPAGQEICRSGRRSPWEPTGGTLAGHSFMSAIEPVTSPLRDNVSRCPPTRSLTCSPECVRARGRSMSSQTMSLTEEGSRAPSRL